MLHVLIVDDEWLDLEGLRDQIPRLLLPPMEIHTAESGIHALQVIQDVPVDIPDHRREHAAARAALTWRASSGEVPRRGNPVCQRV